MSDSRFTIDSNILIYALNRRAGDRHVVALDIMARAPFCDCLLTLQSISEFYAAGTRKGLVTRDEARAQAEDWLDLFPSASPTAHAVRSALHLADSGSASYWDALLIVTAAAEGCKAILTEDLTDGSTLAGIRIINPFAGDGLSPAAEALLASDE